MNACIGEGNGNPLQYSAWRIPGMGEPGGLPSMGLLRVEHDWSDLAAAAEPYEGLPYHSSVGKESACNAGDSGSIPGSERSAGEGIGYPLQFSQASFVAQLIKNLPAMWETWVRSLGWIPGLGWSPEQGKGYPLQYSDLENSMDYTVHEVTKSRTRLSYFHFQSPTR